MLRPIQQHPDMCVYRPLMHRTPVLACMHDIQTGPVPMRPSVPLYNDGSKIGIAHKCLADIVDAVVEMVERLVVWAFWRSNYTAVIVMAVVVWI